MDVAAVPLQSRERLSAARVPQPDCAVDAAADQEAAIGRKRQGIGWAGVRLERRQQPSTVGLAQPHGPVQAAAG
jgi:hypothetical protein